MRPTIPPAYYSRASITLHWLMLALLVAVYASIELREFFPKGSGPREGLKSWHFTLGLCVLALVWARIAARLMWPAPKRDSSLSAWQHVAAKSTHFMLYFLMIAMPLTGWLILSAEEKAIPFFIFEIPPLTGGNESFANRVESLHEVGGTIGYWLIGLHASAALFHQYIIRDDLLSRMLPTRL
jgi:superoxide oxidase